MLCRILLKLWRESTLLKRSQHHWAGGTQHPPAWSSSDKENGLASPKYPILALNYTFNGMITGALLYPRLLGRPSKLAFLISSSPHRTNIRSHIHADMTETNHIPLPRRPLGLTGLEVSVLGFGASPLGGVFQVPHHIIYIIIYHTNIDSYI